MTESLAPTNKLRDSDSWIYVGYREPREKCIAGNWPDLMHPTYSFPAISTKIRPLLRQPVERAAVQPKYVCKSLSPMSCAIETPRASWDYGCLTRILATNCADLPRRLSAVACSGAARRCPLWHSPSRCRAGRRSWSAICLRKRNVPRLAKIPVVSQEFRLQITGFDKFPEHWR